MGAVVKFPQRQPRTLAEIYCRQQSTAMRLLLAQEAAAQRVDYDWLREFRSDPFIASLGWGRSITESF